MPGGWGENLLMNKNQALFSGQNPLHPVHPLILRLLNSKAPLVLLQLLFKNC